MKNANGRNFFNFMGTKIKGYIVIKVDFNYISFRQLPIYE